MTNYLNNQMLYPEMFGAVANSPSSDCSAAIQACFAAFAATGMPMRLSPNMYYCNTQVVLDISGRWGNGINLVGAAAQSVLNFNAGVASPNFQMTDTTGYVAPSDGQKPEFYGAMRDFQIWGTPSLSGGTIGGVTALFGEATEASAGAEKTYFNGFAATGLVVKNNAVNGGGKALQMFGLTTCNVDVTATAGGSNYDGSIALELGHVGMTRIAGSFAAAENGIAITRGANIGNRIVAPDIEVVKIGFKNTAVATADLTIEGGTFSTLAYIVDCATSSGNIELNHCQMGGVGGGLFRNPSAALGTWGGYGVTVKSAYNSLGYIWPGSGTALGALPTVPVTATWYRNIWGQDAEVTIYNVPATCTLARRDWNDSSSGGMAYPIGGCSAMSVLVKAGESIMLTFASGTPYTAWRLGVQ